MKKTHLNFMFIILIAILTIMFFYSGFNYSVPKNENSAIISPFLYFKLSTITEIIGIGLILSIFFYIVIRKTIKNTTEN